MATAGTYGTIDTRRLSWLDKTVTPVEKKPKKKEPKIVNEIFEQAASYAVDNFWKDKLHDAALGKFPRGISYEELHPVNRWRT
jgi:hypothetical protein